MDKKVKEPKITKELGANAKDGYKMVALKLKLTDPMDITGC